MSLAARTRSLWARLGLATTPGDPEEARAFLQRRIALFVAGCFVLWLLMGVASELSALWLPDPPERGFPSLLHHAGTLLLGLGWWLARSGRRSRAQLALIDAGTAIVQALSLSLIMTTIALRFRPDMSITMGISYVLVARAALVPSDPLRTLLVGTLCALSLLGGTLASYLNDPWRTLPVGVAAAQVGTWAVLGVMLSVLISRVIYGLRQRVEQSARLGQYTLEHKLGEGGMGVVYRARHALLRRPTAIKLLHPSLGAGTFLQRFEREVQLTSTLRNPHTIVIYDYGRTPERTFYYVMEYLDGASLEELVARTGPMPEARVVHVLRGLCSALEEAHAVGLVHRDIKPGNAILCKLGLSADFVKLLDFGLVKQLRSDVSEVASGNNAIIGTPLYMAPEAITRPDGVDARSDLYALGALGYFLLTGQPPFTGNTALEVCAKHLTAPVPSLPERRGGPVEPALEQLILACLAKDPALRPPSARAVLEVLLQVQLEPWSDARAEAAWALYRQREGRASAPGEELANTVAVDLQGR